MDEEKKPKVTIADLSAQAGASSSAPQESSTVAPKESKTDYVFFNVMPKSKDDASMTQPTLKVEYIEDVQNPSQSFLKKYKLYIICGLGILILGPLIYYFVNKIGAGSFKPDDLVIKPGHTSTTTPTITASSTQTQAGFTTPQDWRDKYFPGCKDSNICGDNGDADQDGLSNAQEFKLKTDPNNPDSDKDGLSDGDEVNIFNSDPLNAHTSNDPTYSDGDYIKGGYDFSTGKKFTSQQIGAISAKMKNFGLHQPTIKTLGDILNSLYRFSTGNSTSTPESITPSSTPTTLSSTTPTTIDQSLAAKQDRDTQRSSTIKNIEAALLKYKSDIGSYPKTNDFATMFANVKPYLKVATNPLDPINKSPYVYSYTSSDDASDFTLTFYSEVAGQPIRKHAADAIKDTGNQQAAIYDDQRQNDLENIRTALLLYSQNNSAGNQTYVFPSADKYKIALVPTYLEQIPKDPKTSQDYQYQVSTTFNTFTLKATLDNPPVGTTGYLCNQEECSSY
jgi:hypothetical protein